MKYRQLFMLGLATLLVQQALAQTPSVVTDTRFARGATMAFGRIKSSNANGGAAIQKRGFCLAEHNNPTIDDVINTSTLTNNGLIYYFKDLKPATKYYMRAYATNKDGVTGYGDVIKFYTIPKGTIQLTMRSGGDQATYNRIKEAAETAVNWWNNLTEMKGFGPNVGYESGTPTADCSYGGWIRVGPNTSYQRCGTIMHEMLHGIGVIPWADTEWSRHNLRSGVNGDGYGTGYWLGDRVTEVLTFWDNKVQKLNGDYQHLWPYGINGASEDNGSDLLYIGNSLVCQALGEDGLQHTSSLFAEPYYALNQEDNIKYYIKNESADRGLNTSFLKPNAVGALKWTAMTSAEAAQNDSTAWYITFTPDNQYYQFRNAATGQYLTSSGGIKTAAKTTLTANEDWHLMKGRVDVVGQRGYWIIHPESNWTPRCLQANANGNTGTATFDIANSAEHQRWLIMTMEDTKSMEAKAVEQVKQTVAEALTLVKALADVPHEETVAGTDAALLAVVSEVETCMAASENLMELAALVDKAKAAAAAFLRNVTPIDMATPFDLTYMLVNPTLDETADGWTGDATVSYGCAEFYQKTFDFSQTVKNLPMGTYAFCGQGFQRPGSYSATYNDYMAGNNKVNAVIYAGESSELLANICDGIQTRKVGKGNEAAVTNGRYIPNDMQSADAYFKKGIYDNRVVGAVMSDGGSLKVGVKSTSMPSSYWAIFDNFRLYYYGNLISGKTYKLTYYIDNEVYKQYSVECGSNIIVEPFPTKTGYIFSGWSEIPETMPNHDVTIIGSFTENSYALNYQIDGETYKSYKLNYGTTIIPETEPIREGYTFSGWSEIPETMPANDVTVTGTFSINQYKLTYVVDGEEYKMYEVEYGTSITPEEAPTKVGYDFTGWSEIPETMPAHDVTVTGSFEPHYDVGNVASLIDVILNGNGSLEDFELYDMNGDGELNIGDLILILREVLKNTGGSAPSRGVVEWVEPDYTQYTAAQFVLDVPLNVREQDIQLAEGIKQTHKMMSRQIEPGRYAVVVYSLTNSKLAPGFIEVKTETAHAVDLDIKDMVLAKPTGETASFGNMAVATVVSDVRCENAPRSVYDLKGQKQGNSLQKGVYIENGKKIVIR